MKEEISTDIGEEIISKLKELNKILEKIMQGVKDGKKCSPSHSFRY